MSLKPDRDGRHLGRLSASKCSSSILALVEWRKFKVFTQEEQEVLLLDKLACYDKEHCNAPLVFVYLVSPNGGLGIASERVDIVAGAS